MPSRGASSPAPGHSSAAAGPTGRGPGSAAARWERLRQARGRERLLQWQLEVLFCALYPCHREVKAPSRAPGAPCTAQIQEHSLFSLEESKSRSPTLYPSILSSHKTPIGQMLSGDTNSFPGKKLIENATKKNSIWMHSWVSSYSYTSFLSSYNSMLPPPFVI